MAMQPWFPDAKLGIFIHWGIYAVDGVQESWSFFDGDVPHDQYMAQLDRFTAAAYDPREWAALFARAGARYAVLTSRHHDGVALWDTALGDLNVVRHTPAGHDLVGPYAEALREQGLKVGLYYSHSDWNHPDYASTRYEGRPPEQEDNPYAEVPKEQEDLEAWARYLDYRDGQVRELCTRYRPDLLWFDGEWERTEEQWRIRELADLIRSEVPECVLNARMLSHGDYATPEQGVPIVPPDGPWELCLTINDSWGYQHHDHNHKSTGQLVRYFTETIGAGGNLLLDVGPKEDGTIPAEQVERLEGLGAWIARHADAVYGTVRGLPAGHHYGPSTLSADGRTLYLVLFDIPRGPIGVRGLRTPVHRVSVLGTGTGLGHQVIGGLHEAPGVLWIDAPAAADLDEHATVLAVELDGELDLYRGGGRS
ncbi:alpha-L-fucosidase [Streptomyces jeddahensis]|uniref:alpha-L-fucosidase n=1 Tax=Streptomyces jeddahensis TaxID=1716141 RepID=A0A177HPZ7_9ACTN|nr:alpha-L-fucosidase [Streptomyces jeddahensis]OAH12679.1 alpha-L-fucosidase [Streptomyces jeddahensis]